MTTDRLIEDQIERRVEGKMNALDSAFMRAGSAMTQAEYDAHVKEINKWAEEQYRTVRK